MASRTPASTASMNSSGRRPPVTSFTNSYGTFSPSIGSMVSRTLANWPVPPLWPVWTYSWCSTVLRIVSRYATRGSPKSASTSNSPFRRATSTLRCSSPVPPRTVRPLRSSTWALRNETSSARRRMAASSFSWSPFDLGAMTSSMITGEMSLGLMAPSTSGEEPMRTAVATQGTVALLRTHFRSGARAPHSRAMTASRSAGAPAAPRPRPGRCRHAAGATRRTW